MWFRKPLMLTLSGGTSKAHESHNCTNDSFFVTQSSKAPRSSFDNPLSHKQVTQPQLPLDATKFDKFSDRDTLSPYW
jgi:hypothetical protein